MATTRSRRHPRLTSGLTSGITRMSACTTTIAWVFITTPPAVGGSRSEYYRRTCVADWALMWTYAVATEIPGGTTKNIAASIRRNVFDRNLARYHGQDRILGKIAAMMTNPLGAVSPTGTGTAGVCSGPTRACHPIRKGNHAMIATRGVFGDQTRARHPIRKGNRVTKKRITANRNGGASLHGEKVSGRSCDQSWRPRRPAILAAIF